MEVIDWILAGSSFLVMFFVGIAWGRRSQKKLDSEWLRDITWSRGCAHVEPKRKQATKEQLGD